MQRHGNAHTLLERIQNETAILEKNLEVSQGGQAWKSIKSNRSPSKQRKKKAHPHKKLRENARISNVIRAPTRISPSACHCPDKICYVHGVQAQRSTFRVQCWLCSSQLNTVSRPVQYFQFDLKVGSISLEVQCTIHCTTEQSKNGLIWAAISCNWKCFDKKNFDSKFLTVKTFPKVLKEFK